MATKTTKQKMMITNVALEECAYKLVNVWKTRDGHNERVVCRLRNKTKVTILKRFKDYSLIKWLWYEGYVNNGFLEEING